MFLIGVSYKRYCVYTKRIATHNPRLDPIKMSLGNAGRFDLMIFVVAYVIRIFNGKMRISEPSFRGSSLRFHPILLAGGAWPAAAGSLLSPPPSFPPFLLLLSSIFQQNKGRKFKESEGGELLRAHICPSLLWRNQFLEEVAKSMYFHHVFLSSLIIDCFISCFCISLSHQKLTLTWHNERRSCFDLLAIGASWINYSQCVITHNRFRIRTQKKSKCTYLGERAMAPPSPPILLLMYSSAFSMAAFWLTDRRQLIPAIKERLATRFASNLACLNKKQVCQKNVTLENVSLERQIL